MERPKLVQVKKKQKLQINNTMNMDPSQMKMQSLQRHKPFLKRFIKSLKDDEDNLENQIDKKIKKLEQILIWITDKTKLPLICLNRCESTIKFYKKSLSKTKKVVPSSSLEVEEEISLISSDDDDDVEFIGIVAGHNIELEKSKQKSNELVNKNESVTISPVKTTQTNKTNETLNNTHTENVRVKKSNFSILDDEEIELIPIVESSDKLSESRDFNETVLPKNCENKESQKHKKISKDKSVETSKVNSSLKNNTTDYQIVNCDPVQTQQYFPHQPTLNASYSINFGQNHLVIPSGTNSNVYYPATQCFQGPIQTPFFNGQHIVTHISNNQHMPSVAPFNQIEFVPSPQPSTTFLPCHSSSYKNKNYSSYEKCTYNKSNKDSFIMKRKQEEKYNFQKHQRSDDENMLLEDEEIDNNNKIQNESSENLIEVKQKRNDKIQEPEGEKRNRDINDKMERLKQIKEKFKIPTSKILNKTEYGSKKKVQWLKNNRRNDVEKSSSGRLSNKENRDEVRLLAECPVPTDKFLKKVKTTLGKENETNLRKTSLPESNSDAEGDDNDHTVDEQSLVDDDDDNLMVGDDDNDNDDDDDDDGDDDNDQAFDNKNNSNTLCVPVETIDNNLGKIGTNTEKSGESKKDEVVKTISRNFSPDIAQSLIDNFEKNLSVLNSPPKELTTVVKKSDKNQKKNNIRNKKITKKHPDLIAKNKTNKQKYISKAKNKTKKPNYKRNTNREYIFLMRDLKNCHLGKAVQNLTGKRVRCQSKNYDDSEIKKAKDLPLQNFLDLNELPKNVNRNYFYKNSLVTNQCLFCKKCPKLLSCHYLTVHKTEAFNSRLSSIEIKRLKENPVIAPAISEKGMERFRVKCVFCNILMFGTINVIIRHYTLHTGEFTIKCTHCDFMRPFIKDVQRHCQRNKRCEGSQPKTISSYDLEANSIQLHYCNLCNYVQINDANILKHLRTEHSIENPGTKHSKNLLVAKLLRNFKKSENTELNIIKTEINEEYLSTIQPFNDSTKEIQTIKNYRKNKNFENIVGINQEEYNIPSTSYDIESNSGFDDKLQKFNYGGCFGDNEREKLLRLIAFFKCTVSDCLFATNSIKGMISHLECHQQNDNKLVFQCVYCNKTNFNANSLTKHICNSHSKSLFQCNKCTYRSTSATNVRIHKEKVHPVCENFVIYICKQFESNIVQPNDSLCACRCLDCEEKFSTVDRLEVHINRCHKKPLTRSKCEIHFACIYCFFSSEDVQIMREHLSDNHEHMTMAACENFKIMPKTNSQEILQVLINSTVIKDLNEDESHFLKPCPFQQSDLNITDQSISPVNSIIPKFVTSAELFKCGFNFCALMSADLTQFEIHSKQHNESIYLCPHCKLVILSQEDFFGKILNHVKMHDAKIYCCGDCNYFNWSRPEVLNHFQIQHKLNDIRLITLNRNETKTITNIELILPPEEKYIKNLDSCFICSTKFDTETLDPKNIEIDIKSHYWEKHDIKILYKCNYCVDGKALMDYDTIQKHVQKQHSKPLYRLHCEFVKDDSNFILTTLQPFKVISVRKHKRSNISDTDSETQQFNLSSTIQVEELIIKSESTDGIACAPCINPSFVHKMENQDNLILRKKNNDFEFLFICFYCLGKYANINELNIHFSKSHPSEKFTFKGIKKSSCEYCYYMDSFENPADSHRLHFSFYFCIRRTTSTINNQLDTQTILNVLQKHLNMIKFNNANMYPISQSKLLTDYLQINDEVMIGEKSMFTSCLIIPYFKVCEHYKRNIAIFHFSNALTTTDKKILYGCEICKILSLNKKEIILHHRRHVKPYICICHKEYTDFQNLKTHINDKHNGKILPNQRCIYRTQVSLIEEYLKMRIIFNNGFMVSGTQLYGTVHSDNEVVHQACKSIDEDEQKYYSNFPHFEIVN